MEKYFELKLEVRDYELDMQGIVNNSVYLNYLEHARHKALIEMGFSFEELNLKGIEPVVVKVEMEYKKPLKSRDEFIIKTKVEKLGPLKIMFFQEIFQEKDNLLMLKAIFTTVCLKNGRPNSNEILFKT